MTGVNPLAEPCDVFRFTTAGMSAPVAFDAYCALYAAGADPVMEGDDFRASMVSRRFSRLMVYDRNLYAIGHRRHDARVRRDDFSHFTATLCLNGTLHGSGSDGFRRINPGEMLLLDMSRPMATQSVGAHFVTMSIGREIVESIAGDARRLHGRVFDRERAAPLLRYLTTLMVNGAGGMPAWRPAEDVAALLRDVADPTAADAAARLRGARLFAVRQLVERELDDPDLDAVRLSRRLGVSRATLYRLFVPFGGVAQYILNQRLLRLRRLLAGRASRGFATLADEIGFASESHASRVFLDRFGERPGRFRRIAHDLNDADYAALCMTLWQAELR